MLVTHQLQYLSRPQVSRVIVLAGGAVVLDGPWRDIQLRATADMADFCHAGGHGAAGPVPRPQPQPQLQPEVQAQPQLGSEQVAALPPVPVSIALAAAARAPAGPLGLYRGRDAGGPADGGAALRG